MTTLFKTHPLLSELNGQSFSNPRVHVINPDAFVWLDSNRDYFDFAVVDFPDPTNYSLGKLYTTAFYRVLAKHLSRGGMFVVQSTSPLFARQSYWCIVEHARSGWHEAVPLSRLRAVVRRVGICAGGARIGTSRRRSFPPGLRFLSAQNVPELFRFPLDMRRVPAEPNRLNDQILVRYYDHEWKEIAR